MIERTRVGVVVSHPIQYFTPLFDLLTERGRIEVRILYGNDAGTRPQFDPGFGIEHRWDLDLVSRHDHEFATRGACVSRRSRVAGLARTFRFVRSREVLVIHGYAGALTVAAILSCWVLRKPYWLRSDTSTRRDYRPWDPREVWPRLVYRFARGALAVGQRNAAIVARYGAKSAPVAPYAVDNDRFRRAADKVRRSGAPSVVFAGKLIAHKRVSDLVKAAWRLPDVDFLIVGEGPLGAELRAGASCLGNVSFAGFKNQSEMPRALASCHVLVLPSDHEAWGLIVNEAMACGLVPVVSEAVGCAPDLVEGIGEVYPTGDIDALCSAIESALQTAAADDIQARLRERVGRYSLDECARA